MSIPGAASPLFLTSAAADAAAYQIDRSLRFNSADSAQLGKTFSSAGSTTTWTLSFWIKRSNTSGNQSIFMSYNGSSIAEGDYANLEFNSDGELIVGYAYAAYKHTNRVFKDFSSWYHIVVRLDTGNSTASDRVQVYVNGVKETSFKNTHDPDSGQSLAWNKAHIHRLGSEYNQRWMNGYLAEVHFVDGTALNADSFGEFDSNNVWQPKDCQSSLTYGTNGFYLKFDDTSSNSALGTDSSGNNFDWTPSNLTASALATGTVSGAGTPANASGSGGWAQAFDGSTSTLVYSSTGNDTTTFTLTDPIAWTSKIRIYAGQNATSGTNIIANGVNLSSSVTWALTGEWQEVTSHLTSPLTSLGLTSVGGQSSNIRAVEIDNTVIVQGDAEDIDSLIDTPTNYTADSSNNGGNYCTFNPLAMTSGVSLTNGNLDASSSAADKFVVSTIFASTGKWYAEFLCNSAGTEDAIGIVTNEYMVSEGFYSANQISAYRPTGAITTSSFGSVTFPTWTTGDIIRVKLDLDNQKFAIAKNGGSFTEVTITSYDSHVAGESWSFRVGNGSSGGSGSFNYTANWGQRSFSYAPPTGFLSLCTQNLSDPTISDGSTAFDTLLYTGDGTSSRNLTLPLAADFVWIKKRSATQSHQLADTVRGNNAVLLSNSDGREYNPQTEFVGGGISSISNTTVTLSQGTSNNDNTNANNATFVGWLWDAGTSTASNTDGSITSNVRANQSAGFSIVTYTGVAPTVATVGHGLNAAPDLIIIKVRDRTGEWPVFHSALDISKTLYLEQTAAQSGGHWNSTAPTSSVFTVGDSAYVNGSGDPYVAYCFAAVAGFSAFGSYTGNGSSDGPFQYLGFRPAWLLIKKTTSADNWILYDTKRNTYNVSNKIISPNTSGAEDTTSTAYTNLDILSNGFKVRASTGGTIGGGGSSSSDSYIYAAFAEHPFKTARAR